MNIRAIKGKVRIDDDLLTIDEAKQHLFRELGAADHDALTYAIRRARAWHSATIQALKMDGDLLDADLENEMAV